MFSVREFIQQSYRLTSANSPTLSLRGEDLSLGIRLLNQQLASYASSGQLITIAKTVSLNISKDKREVTTGSADVVPTPDITEGRLANLDHAWVVLQDVTYPLQQKDRAEFLASYRFEPLTGLPRLIYVFPEVQTTTLRIYPAPSETFELNIRGKFQLNELDSNDDMDLIPSYYQRYLLISLGRDIAFYKGRSEAWTDKLESMYREARDNMIAASEVNLTITGDNESLLNGHWRLRSGV